MALEYDKNKWGLFCCWNCLLLRRYSCSGFIIGLLAVLISGVDSVNDDSFTNSGWNILLVLFGALAFYGVYRLLENKCEKEKELQEKEGIGSIGVIEEN
ncbi:hypothetical protein [Flavobacterium ustbae]|uniref:hypothetical protein n=1 Tax=Flavobacterium ustbae TaxID=2488790 RepID=UPI000F78271C|nr:hypothetical protein [Flavobacterium ustbae]